MEVIKIGETDIMLDDMGNGKGKITISNTYGYNFSYYWGSMGRSLREFLRETNESYFISNLLPPYDSGEFDGKKTMRNVRKFIKDEMSYELPWYKYMEQQKNLRERLNEIQRCESDRQFVDEMMRISQDVDGCYELDKYDREEFISALKMLECEPWHWIEMGPSDNERFLTKLFPKLQKELKKSNHELSV